MTPTRPPLLGDLETAVMEYLWARGPCDVKGMHRAVGTRRRITPNTVQSTMERLYRKGLLDREKVSHAYVYSARQTRAEFGQRVVETLVSGIFRGDAEPMLSAFVDLAERAGTENLEHLARLIAERRAAMRGRSK